jgi:hypothetical protein
MFMDQPTNASFMLTSETLRDKSIRSGSRRLKIPLRDISSDTIRQMLADPSLVLETKVPGTGKDGGPNCATVKPFSGWHLSPSS